MATIDDGKVQLGVRVAPAVREELKILAIRRGRTMQDEVEAALRAHLGAARRESGAGEP
jgi:hypothetical protein